MRCILIDTLEGVTNKMIKNLARAHRAPNREHRFTIID